MKKLNSVIYNKLLLQAEEAKEQGMTKLAAGVMGALTAIPEEEISKYSSEELNEDIHNYLWKIAVHIIKYYDLSSVDAEKVNEALEFSGQTVLNAVCASLGVNSCDIGANEPELPGENK